jgi:hypothetical protein
MPSTFSAAHSFPFLTGFNPRERNIAEKAFGKYEDGLRTRNTSRGRTAERLIDDVNRQLHNLMGARKFALLREGLQEERLSLVAAMQPPAGLKRVLSRQKAVGRKRIDSLIRKLGINRTKVNRIIQAASAKAEAAFLPDLRKVAPGLNVSQNLSKWTKLSPLHKFPIHWGQFEQVEDPNDPHRWFLFRPPFFGFLFDEDIVATDRFTVSREMFLHPPSGLVGNKCRMDCESADDIDVAHVIGETQLAIGFRPPVAGVIEVLIDAQCTIGSHFISIEDEFGFSEAWCNQHNLLMMNVLHPNVPQASMAQMSSFGLESGGDDVSGGQSTLVPGQHYYAQLFSTGPVPAGQHVIITFGTRSFDICFENDMELHSTTDFRWFISSLEVRIAP